MLQHDCCLLFTIFILYVLIFCSFTSNGFGSNRNEHRTNSEGSFRGHNNQHGNNRGPGSAGGNHGNNRGYNNSNKHGMGGGIYGNNGKSNYFIQGQIKS